MRTYTDIKRHEQFSGQQGECRYQHFRQSGAHVRSHLQVGEIDY